MKKITFYTLLFITMSSLVGCGNKYFRANSPNKISFYDNPSKDSIANKRIVLIMSADGFRADYIEHSYTPNIDSIIKVGTSGALRPSYPSQTFPNHYSIATGLYPNNHGIVSNYFYDKELGTYHVGNKKENRDGRFYYGEPIWNTVQKNGKKSIVYFWVGGEAPIGGMRPNIWFSYNSHTPFEQRADRVFEEINKNKPSLAMLYIEQPDKAGHYNGADSPITYREVEKVDKFIGYILNKIRQSPQRDNIDFILVSDHGMATIKHEIRLLDYIKAEEMTQCFAGAICQIYLKDKSKIDEILNRFQKLKNVKAYKKEDIPQKFHYGSDPRIGDIVLIPDVGTYINYNTKTTQKGTHGYDNYTHEMRAIFACFGPDFKAGKRLKEDIPNVNIYPLICRILNITPAKNDGDKNIVDYILK